MYLGRDEGSLTANDDVSVCYRFKMASVSASSGSSNDRAVFAFAGTDSNFLSALIAHAHDGTRQVIAWTWVTTYAAYVTRTRYNTGNGAIFDTSRYQIAAMKLRKSTGAFTCYVDGAALGSAGGSGSGYNSTFSAGQVMNFGRWVGGDRHFDGQIGTIGVWLGTLLSDTDLQKLSQGMEPRLAGTLPSRYPRMRYTNQASSASETDAITGASYAATNSPAAAVDPYGLLIPPVSGRLQKLAARMGGGF